MYGDSNNLLLTTPFLYTKKRSFTSDSKNHINILDPNFVTGLTESEGSFSITKHKETKGLKFFRCNFEKITRKNLPPLIFF